MKRYKFTEGEVYDGVKSIVNKASRPGVKEGKKIAEEIISAITENLDGEQGEKFIVNILNGIKNTIDSTIKQY